ncbi:MAG TPA: hypothetical protein VGP96_05170 [Candidatus Dormibacteraeota bacterium]|nr:hypothetical protein [Candidatus Dormibacteraeota bacterium]
MTRTQRIRVAKRIAGAVTAAVAVGGAAGAVVDASGRSAMTVAPASTPSPHRTPSPPHASHIAGSGLPNTSSTPVPGSTRRSTHRPTPTPAPTPTP